MKEDRISYFWIIPIALIIPIVQVIIYMIRFSSINRDVFMNSMSFIPTGLISGLVLIYLLRLSQERRTRRNSVIGFIIMLPVSIFIMIFLGLIAPIILVVTVIGSIPLILESFIGYKL